MMDNGIASDTQDRPEGLVFRYAAEDDIGSIVALLADDVLGSAREVIDANDLTAYKNAFSAMMDQGGNNYLLALDADETVLGCLQITIIPGLSRTGTSRAQIEGVRVATAARGRGVGRQLFERAHEIAIEKDCTLVQLTTDKQRDDARRFYESMGYENTHHGMKLKL